MKRFPATVLATFALALAVWAFFYVTMPDAPLTLGGTAVVVAACAGVVYFSRWMWKLFRK